MRPALVLTQRKGILAMGHRCCRLEATRLYQLPWDVLQIIPGIDPLCATLLLVEIDVDMQRFGSMKQLSSSGGMLRITWNFHDKPWQAQPLSKRPHFNASEAVLEMPR